MINVGQKVKFNPFKDIRLAGAVDVDTVVDGVVNYVHPTHRWFNVRYDSGEGMRLTSYKFDEIGRAVKLVKEKEYEENPHFIHQNIRESQNRRYYFRDYTWL